MKIRETRCLLENQHFSLYFIPVLIAEEDYSQVDAALSGGEHVFLETIQKGLESRQSSRQRNDDVHYGYFKLKWLFKTDSYQRGVRA